MAPVRPAAAPVTAVAELPWPNRPTTAGRSSSSGRNAARAAEREMMLRMLHRTRWNRKEAAGILGISYKAMLYKIKEHGLDGPVTARALPARG